MTYRELRDCLNGIDNDNERLDDDVVVRIINTETMMDEFYCVHKDIKIQDGDDVLDNGHMFIEIEE